MTQESLEIFQSDLARAIAEVGPAEEAHIGVYRNNHHHAVGNALADAYPVVQALVGEVFFVGLARAFATAHPPRKKSLVAYGAELPGFIAAFEPARSLPYLADVARLERAWLEALHSADCAVLAMEDLTAAVERLEAARLIPHPATRLLISPFPIFQIWDAHRGGGTPERLKLVGEGQGVLVTRPALQVSVTLLSGDAASLARGLLDGLSIAEAVGESGMAAELQTTFHTLFSAGAFAALDVSNTSRSETKG